MCQKEKPTESDNEQNNKTRNSARLRKLTADLGSI